MWATGYCEKATPSRCSRRNMPMNNNQKVQSAAARLVQLPVLRSACTRLSVLYTDSKCSHPSLRCVCEVLESSVTAALSPVLDKLEPQISVANNVACRSLDWLETAFPVLHTPTEQILATAKSKMHEIQDAVGMAANGTMDCVEHTVAWLTGSIQQANDQPDQPLVERAISVARVGLDSALTTSEALMDRVLPPTEEDEEGEARLVEGFEEATLRRSYSVRLVSLTVKLCRRTYHMVESKIHSVQVIQNLTRSTGLVQDLQTSWLSCTWSIQALPQFLQHQLVSVLFFMSQMYNLSCPPPQHHQPDQEKRWLNAVETPTHKEEVQVQLRSKPTCRMRRPGKSPGFDNGCNVKGCLR